MREENRLTFDHEEIIAHLREDRIDVFEAIFRTYHPLLFRFCLKFVREKQAAEEIVQDVFIYIWDKRHQVKINKSLTSYLYTATRHRSINYLKLQYNQYHYDDEPLGMIESTHSAASDLVEQSELTEILDQAIHNLPERCKMVFTLSRQAGLTYAEIAKEMDISVKTVEIQMGTALKRIRHHLQQSGFIWLTIILMKVLIFFTLVIGVSGNSSALNTSTEILWENFRYAKQVNMKE